MAQIANVRSFNGSSDNIQLSFTGGVFDQTAIGATTHAAICLTDTDSGFHWFIGASGGAGGKWAGGQNSTAVSLFFNPNTKSSGAGVFTTAMGWCLLAITRADGTSTPRYHRYRYDTANWSHTDDAGTLAETAPLDGAQIWIGSYDASSEFWDGKIACVGVWYATALTDGQLEGMTSAISTWDALSPTGLWLLNQTSTSDPVLDRVGSTDEIAISGTTVTAESSLVFDVGGTTAADDPPMGFSGRGAGW